MHQRFYPQNPVVNRFISGALLAMAAIYLAGAFTPLHLHFDSVRYFNIRECIELGCPPESQPAQDYLPYGFTGLLIALSKLGILNAFTIVFVNCLFLFGALYFTAKIFRRQIHPALFMVVALFNWTVIKFTLHPLSEMQYLFFSTVSLYCFHKYTQEKSYWQLALSIVFCLAAVMTRTVGISLVPALALGFAWQYKTGLIRNIKKNKIILIGIVLIGAALAFIARYLKILDYTQFLKEPLEKGIFNFLGENLKFHFTELAEVFINMPGNKVLNYMPAPLGTIFFVVIGVACFLWVLNNLLTRRARIPFYIRVYMLFYMLIIFNWPYYDPRFWVPMVPLLAVVILRTPFELPAWAKGTGKLYLTVYLFLGFFAAGYALYTGFNKERFARNHAAGEYRNEYEVHFFGKPLSDTATRVDQNVVEILKKFD